MALEASSGGAGPVRDMHTGTDNAPTDTPRIVILAPDQLVTFDEVVGPALEEGSVAMVRVNAEEELRDMGLGALTIRVSQHNRELVTRLGGLKVTRKRIPNGGTIGKDTYPQGALQLIIPRVEDPAPRPA